MFGGRSLFTDEVVADLIKLMKTNEIGVHNFKKCLESRITNREILAIARSWDREDDTAGMKQNLAVATVGVFYAGAYLYFMEYLCEKLKSEEV